MLEAFMDKPVLSRCDSPRHEGRKSRAELERIEEGRSHDISLNGAIGDFLVGELSAKLDQA